jgi:predicted DNA-binding protein (UPF0251 family)
MPELQVVLLEEDELEALRLCDLEGLDQAGAGRRMGVSRGTVQRLVKKGRSTLVRALVENAALVIGAGSGSDANSGEEAGRTGEGGPTGEPCHLEGRD